MPSAVAVRCLLTLPGVSLLALTLACTRTRPQPRNEIARRDGDVLASGPAPRVTDSVPGDAMLAGGQVVFSGATGGDYLGVGGSQVVGGRIHGSARAAGGEIHVTATIDHNATIAGGNLTLDHTAVVGRNAYFAGGEIHIDGTVGQGLQVSGGTVVLDGRMNGDVEVTAGTLRIGPHATIAGALHYRVPRGQAHIDPGARMLGTVTALPVQRWRGFERAFRVIRFIWLLGFLVAGAVAVALAPHLATRAAAVLAQRPGYSSLVGIAWLVVLPIAAVLVAMTVIGIPLALLTGVIYFALAYLGRVVVAVWLGRMILGARTTEGRGGTFQRFIIGGVLLVIVALVPVLGSLVMLVATVMGLGALLLEIRDRTAAPLAS